MDEALERIDAIVKSANTGDDRDPHQSKRDRIGEIAAKQWTENDWLPYQFYFVSQVGGFDLATIRREWSAIELFDCYYDCRIRQALESF